MNDTKFMVHISKLMKTNHLTYEQALAQSYKDYGIEPIVEKPLPIDIVIPTGQSPRQDKLPDWAKYSKKEGEKNDKGT